MNDEVTSTASGDELVQRVIEVIAETQLIPLETVTIDSSFEELGLSSLDGVSIVFELEHEFNISLPNGDALMIRSVRDAVESLRKRLATDAEAEVSAGPAVGA